MTKSTLLGVGLLLLGNVSGTPAATAQTATPAEAAQSIIATVESRAFSDDRGSLRSLTVEHKFDNGDTTILLAPTAGERRVAGAKDASLGIGGTIYRDWSQTVSTRTNLFVAEKAPVFAHVDVAQDVTIRLPGQTTVTTGVRWAEYFGDREATFYSLGARRYFSGGSIGYRLTRTQAEGQDGFFAHLVNLSLNDSQGKGRTQLWLSSGEASTSNSQFDERLAGSNRTLMLQRTQPLWSDVALVVSAGVSSYDYPGIRYTATTIGLGLSVALD